MGIQSNGLHGVTCAVAGMLFVGLPGARIFLSFAAWGTFDSCPEALILGGRGETAAQARENEFSITISGPVWNVFGSIAAGAYVLALCLALCLGFCACVARLSSQRDCKEAGTVEQPEVPA